MAAEQPSHMQSVSQPSTSRMVYNTPMDGLLDRTNLALNGTSYDYNTVSTDDHGEWQYPAHNSSDSDEIELPAGVKGGNWGKKDMKGARWVRKGKAAAWGPDKGEWEMEERARKRLKFLIPRSRSPSPPMLTHLRETSPPLSAPYSPPTNEHTSYASFVLDPAMAHSFRTHLLGDLQQTTENLIQGEATLKRALGHLWKVLSEEKHGNRGLENVAKREEAEDEEEDLSERDRRIARAPDLSQPMHKLFLTPFPNGGTTMIEPSHFGSPMMQLENMEKSLASLKELQDDSREYVERLEEIREGLGDVRRQRDLIWTKVRENALEELKELKQKDEETNAEL